MIIINNKTYILGKHENLFIHNQEVTSDVIKSLIESCNNCYFDFVYNDLVVNEGERVFSIESAESYLCKRNMNNMEYQELGKLMTVKCLKNTILKNLYNFKEAKQCFLNEFIERSNDGEKEEMLNMVSFFLKHGGRALNNKLYKYNAFMKNIYNSIEDPTTKLRFTLLMSWI